LLVGFVSSGSYSYPYLRPQSQQQFDQYDLLGRKLHGYRDGTSCLAQNGPTSGKAPRPALDAINQIVICLRHSFRRSGVGVRFHITPLLVHDAAQLALHRFERVMDHFVERLVRAVVHLPFISDQLVASRHSHIDAAAIRISFVMRVVGLLDGHVAAVDVVAKFFQARCIFQNEIVDLVRFFQTPVRDFNRQLHD